MTDQRGHYFIENGKVYHAGSLNQHLLVCNENDMFGVAWDSDGDILHQHGEATLVRKRLEEIRTALISRGFENMAATLTLATFPATPETLEEVNACIDISNRVGRLEARLAQILPSAMKH